MDRCVIFVMSGAAHLPYLVVSLYALRKHYDGPVRVYAWPESFEIASRICDDFDGVDCATDKYVETICILREPTYRGKNAQFFDKLHVMQEAPGDVNLYLDADTIICGSLDKLFEMGAKGFVATQFCRWTTAGGIIQKRIGRLIDREGIPQGIVERLLTSPPQPSVNGGIWACRPKSRILSEWKRWTGKVLDLFIADEIVLHLVTEAWRQPGFSGTICQIETSGLYNYSPKMFHKGHPHSINEDDVIVWHGHGDCFTRPNKSLEGTDMWMDTYFYCLSKNIGNMAEWGGSVHHKFLDRLLDYLVNNPDNTIKMYAAHLAEEKRKNDAKKQALQQQLKKAHEQVIE